MSLKPRSGCIKHSHIASSTQAHTQAHNTSCTPYTGTQQYIEHKRPGHTVLPSVTQGGHNTSLSESRSVKVCTVQNRINLPNRTPNGVVRVGDRPHTVENGPATVENGKNIIKKISKQGGDDRHSSNTFCTVDTNSTHHQIRTATLTNPPNHKSPQRGLPNRHSEAILLTARPRCSQRGLGIYTICEPQTIHTRSLLNPSWRVGSLPNPYTPSEW